MYQKAVLGPRSLNAGIITETIPYGPCRDCEYRATPSYSVGGSSPLCGSIQSSAGHCLSLVHLTKALSGSELWSWVKAERMQR